MFCLFWGLMSQSTIFQSCRDGATASWVISQYFRGVKCLAQGHNTAAVGFEPPTSRSGVWHSTTELPRSPIWTCAYNMFLNITSFSTFWCQQRCINLFIRHVHAKLNNLENYHVFESFMNYCKSLTSNTNLHILIIIGFQHDLERNWWCRTTNVGMATTLISNTEFCKKHLHL